LAEARRSGQYGKLRSQSGLPWRRPGLTIPLDPDEGIGLLAEAALPDPFTERAALLVDRDTLSEIHALNAAVWLLEC
jgi:hypothetical protein